MTAPAPKRRSRSYDPKAHWAQKSVYLPRALANRLALAAENERKPEKEVIIEALERRLPTGGAKSPNESDDD